MMSTLGTVLAVLALASMAAAQYESFPRNVTKTLRVDNGLDGVGYWRREEFCPEGSYAGGFQLKYEDPVTLDDSGVNAIQLVCLTRDEADDLSYGTADSHTGPWGDWNGRLMCVGATPSDRIFLSKFTLRVDPYSILGYRGVTNVKFSCSEFDNHFSQYTLEGNGGTEGKWGDEELSPECDDGSAICGIAIRFEEPNYFDETAVGDAVMYCCND